jgi:hypothetical protein
MIMLSQIELNKNRNDYFHLIKLFMKVFKFLISFWLLIFFMSCKEDHSKENKIFASMQEGFENSNQRINFDINSYMNSFAEKSVDPLTMEKMKIFNPKIDSVRRNGDVVLNRLKSFKDDIINKSQSDKNVNMKYKNDDTEITGQVLTEQELKMLFKLCTNYKTELFNIDNEIRRVFDTSLIVSNIAGEKKEISSDEFLTTFEGSSKFRALCLLTKIENNILLTQNKIFQFYDCNVSGIRDWYQVESVLIGQSSNVVKPGEKIKISAGVGVFSTKANPIIYINNLKKIVGLNGVAEVDVKSPKKPGKYFIPVKITFTTQAQGTETKNYNIEYTVANLK